MDVNKVWVSGTATTQPVLTRLKSNTQFASFSIQVNERFIDRRQQVVLRPSTFIVEAFGKAAETAVERVQKGQRYTVDGYLRSESPDSGRDVRVRAYVIYKDDTQETRVREEGLKEALDILSTSRDLETAKKKLEDLLAAR